MQVHIIRVDGTEEHVEANQRDIHTLIGADCMDGFSLRDGRYCYVDDTGMVDGKPMNEKATALYWGICRPGTTYPICGDVAIVPNR